MAGSQTTVNLHVAHAEVKALQQKYGLSYKDASHCLYHSQLQKLIVKDLALQSVSKVQQRVDKEIANLSKGIRDIDEGKSEDLGWINVKLPL